MASLTFFGDFGDWWPPDSVQGGTISLRQSDRMVYVSDAGFTVTLRGTGFAYDDDGLPAAGRVTSINIAQNGNTLATFSNIAVDFGRAGMYIFGYDRGDGRFQEPDGFNLWQNALRGRDLVNGSAGDDDLRGGIGNDTINGGAGFDYIGNEQGADVLDGGADRDTLAFDDEANWRFDSFQGVTLDAAAGTAIDSWGFTDIISNFERYRDTIFSDKFLGSAIDETFSLTRGNDTLDGRGGWDRVEYSFVDRWGAQRGVNVNLDTGIARDSWKGTDRLSNIEAVRGSIFNDTLTGSARDEEFIGGDGVDIINGGGGWDSVSLWDAETGVVVNTSLAAQIQNDGNGNTETVTGIERYNGSDFNDLFTGGNANDHFNGNWGNDTLNGGGGADSLQGGGGNDRMTGGTGADDFNFGWDLEDTGLDTITDFAVGVDVIHVGSWWGGGFANEDLVANQFRSGAGVTTANSATQRFIYNTTTGDLYFDADGSGGTAAVRFAVLSNKAALTFNDIDIWL